MFSIFKSSWPTDQNVIKTASWTGDVEDVDTPKTDAKHGGVKILVPH
jgi:hypothetical protein